MDRRTRMTKTLLSNALIDMLKDQDIHKISIRELCQRADVNRSTFYKYYGSQYDLLNEIEDDYVDRITRDLQEDSKNWDYFNSVKNILLTLNENIEISRLLYINKPDTNFFAKIIGKINVEQDIFVDIIDIPEHLKPQVYDFYKLGSYRIICKWLVREDRSNVDEVANLIVEMRKRLFKNY